jgi:hypothetical protein
MRLPQRLPPIRQAIVNTRWTVNRRYMLGTKTLNKGRPW